MMNLQDCSKALQERERRVNELEAIIAEKDAGKNWKDLTVGDVKDKPAFIAVKLLLGLSLVGIGIGFVGTILANNKRWKT